MSVHFTPSTSAARPTQALSLRDSFGFIPARELFEATLFAETTQPRHRPDTSDHRPSRKAQIQHPQA